MHGAVVDGAHDRLVVADGGGERDRARVDEGEVPRGGDEGNGGSVAGAVEADDLAARIDARQLRLAGGKCPELIAAQNRPGRSQTINHAEAAQWWAASRKECVNLSNAASCCGVVLGVCITTTT